MEIRYNGKIHKYCVLLVCRRMETFYCSSFGIIDSGQLGRFYTCISQILRLSNPRKNSSISRLCWLYNIIVIVSVNKVYRRVIQNKIALFYLYMYIVKEFYAYVFILYSCYYMVQRSISIMFVLKFLFTLILATKLSIGMWTGFFLFYRISL
jgi:hypothetical protein